MLYLLTKEEGDVESGVYASVDDEGTSIVQFFIDKDDAITYNVHLEALGQPLHITATENDILDKLCALQGHAYNIVEPGDFVIPRLETLQKFHNDDQ